MVDEDDACSCISRQASHKMYRYEQKKYLFSDSQFVWLQTIRNIKIKKSNKCQLFCQNYNSNKH